MPDILWMDNGFDSGLTIQGLSLSTSKDIDVGMGNVTAIHYFHAADKTLWFNIIGRGGMIMRRINSNFVVEVKYTNIGVRFGSDEQPLTRKDGVITITTADGRQVLEQPFQYYDEIPLLGQIP